MTALQFAIAALAVFRLALMLSSEEGPAAIFARLRRKVPAKTNPGRGVRCFNCWSVWISMAVTAWLWAWLQLPWQHAPLCVFGLSGAAMALNKATAS